MYLCVTGGNPAGIGANRTHVDLLASDYCDYRHNNVTRTTVLHLGSSQSTKRQTVVRL